MEKIFSLVLIVSAISSVMSYPTYVPDAACSSMTPHHGEEPQKSPAPYTVQVSPSIVKQGDVVQVILTGSQPFKGFYVQARTPQGEPVGTFIRNKQVKTHNCNGGQDNAAFHGVSGAKPNMEIYWKAPTDYSGEINFYATFVEEFHKIWTFVRGNPIVVKV